MPRIEIVNDRAVIDGAPAQYVPTAHVGGRIEPTLIILHDTAGGPPGDSVDWLKKNPSQVSAHVIVKPDGSIVQLAPFDLRTNHAGVSEWGGRSSCNGWSIGIEIVNPGQLRGTPDKAVASFGRTYAGAVSHVATKWHGAGLWLPYTEAQLAAVEALVAALGMAYPSIAEVVGHHHVSPGRKVDPTPLMPWERMRQALGNRTLPAVPTEDAIRAAQRRLAELLYPVGEVDGLIGSRTRMAARAFQEQNKLPVTGELDAATIAAIKAPDAKAMPTGARDGTAPANSGTVKAANAGEIVAAVGAAAATGNALTDASTALTEASKVVTTVETGRSLGTKTGDLLAWMMTPRGAVMTACVVLGIATWMILRHIRARRIKAHQEGRQP
jgi:N-acetyl-anhydromuramyl-L-alanine amidase AmpD